MPNLKSYLQRRGLSLSQLLAAEKINKVSSAKEFLARLHLSDAPSDKELHACMPTKHSDVVITVVADSIDEPVSRPAKKQKGKLVLG